MVRMLRSVRLWTVAFVLAVALAPAYGAAMAAAETPFDSTAAVVAAEQLGDPQQPAPPNQEGEAAEDDPFHVSDESLAASIFIPFIFLVSTVWLVWWAWNRRIKPEDREEEYRPNS